MGLPASRSFSAIVAGDDREEAGRKACALAQDGERARAIGGVLTGDPRVRILSFTGSTATGQLLYAQCAPTIKKLGLELGGNAPFIVFDDADLDAAVEGAGRQVPQQRPDLRLRQPLLRPERRA